VPRHVDRMPLSLSMLASQPQTPIPSLPTSVETRISQPRRHVGWRL
jgi:hypothetical protein